MPDMPGLALLIAKKKGSSSEEEEDKASDEEEDKGEDTSHEGILEPMMEQFIKAVKENDVKEALDCFRDMFELLEKLPHDEYSHDEDKEDEEI